MKHDSLGIWKLFPVLYQDHVDAQRRRRYGTATTVGILLAVVLYLVTSAGCVTVENPHVLDIDGGADLVDAGDAGTDAEPELDTSTDDAAPVSVFDAGAETDASTEALDGGLSIGAYCDPFAQNCDPGLGCYVLPTGVAQCHPEGSSIEGFPCTTYSCESGLICGSPCSRPCHYTSGLGCDPDETCFALVDDIGICVETED